MMGMNSIGSQRLSIRSNLGRSQQGTLNNEEMTAILKRKQKLIASKQDSDFTKVPKKENNESNSCRICLGDENTDEDPLLEPCKCSGTMKYIHAECLKNWFA